MFQLSKLHCAQFRDFGHISPALPLNSLLFAKRTSPSLAAGFRDIHMCIYIYQNARAPPGASHGLCFPRLTERSLRTHALVKGPGVMAAGIHTGYILYSIFCKVTFPVTPVERVAEQNAIPSEMARSLGFSCLYFLYWRTTDDPGKQVSERPLIGITEL